LKIYTVGHSNHPIEFFLDLLKTFSISCIVDVRSVPASNYNPQFNKECLQQELKCHNIAYLHFGREFGARHTEPELLDNFGKVDFNKVRASEKFLSGINRLRNGIARGYSIALMCSEADPFDCHRFAMISYYLARNGFDVSHILKDKTLVSNTDLEMKLLKKYKKQIPTTNLWENISPDFQLNLAYKLRNKDVAYDTLNI
jgi:uncharacterized protein (DUF488 family)